MSTYTAAISLSDAKTYLGVSDDKRDSEITRQIKAALSYMEKRTNIIVNVTDKVYYYDNGCVRVYDYPINSTTSTTHEVEVKTLYSIYTEADSDIETITLNVGYTDPTKIDPEWLECGYQVLECFFDGKAVPHELEQRIFTLKRFIA